jgi:hypothetical protein
MTTDGIGWEGAKGIGEGSLEGQTEGYMEGQEEHEGSEDVELLRHDGVKYRRVEMIEFERVDFDWVSVDGRDLEQVLDAMGPGMTGIWSIDVVPDDGSSISE